MPALGGRDAKPVQSEPGREVGKVLRQEAIALDLLRTARQRRRIGFRRRQRIGQCRFMSIAMISAR